MTLESDAKFKEKLVVSYMTWEIWWIFTQPLKSPNISLWCTIFVHSICLWAKKIQGVIFHDTEQWSKIWIKPGLRVSKMGWGIWHGWTFITAPKSLKNYTLIGSLCTKHIMFQIENFRGIIYYEGVAIFKEKRTCGLKYEIRNLVKFHASSQKCENLHFDGILLFKACKD